MNNKVNELKWFNIICLCQIIICIR